MPSQNSHPLKSVPARREQFRAALILVEITVLLLAILIQNLQPPLRDVVVYVERKMVFAASTDGTWIQALLPLNKGCTLYWRDDKKHQAKLRQMDIALDTALPENSRIAFTFQARTLDYQAGHPRVTLHLDTGDIKLWTECPPPPPEPVEMAVYVQGNTLLMVDTATGVITPLMPLRSDLLWSSTASVYLTLDALPAYMVEPEADWLPADAELVGTFTTLTPVEVMTLDSNHLMLRASGEDIVLLSY